MKMHSEAVIKREFVWGTVARMQSKHTTRTGTVDQGLGFRDLTWILEGVLDGSFWNEGSFFGGPIMIKAF